MTDKELIRKVQKGDKDALNKIIECYYDDIYRFCLYLIGEESDSYDITQEVFLRFIKYLSAYKDNNLKGYLLMIARNMCCTYFGRRKITTDIETIELAEENKQLKLVEDKLLLWKLLQKLPLEQREIVVLRIYEELPFKSIAKLLGCNTATVKSRYRLGIAHIRKWLEVEQIG